MIKKTIKQQLLDELYRPYKQCIRCPLGSLGRSHVVFGRGNPDAKLVLIGEAPGRDEDLQGKPFVGRSGKLLSSALEALGVSEHAIYITNIVKCRPPQNRIPTPQEATTCMDILLIRQLQIIQPRVICTLGSHATTSLLNNTVGISKIRGSIHYYRSSKVVPTFHPAYILRNPKELKRFAEDLEKAFSLSNSD